MGIAKFVPYSSSLTYEKMQYYGVLGDYIGGTIGTIVAAISIPLLFASLMATRKASYRSQIYALVSEMLKSHEDIVSSLVIGTRQGRDAFRSILSEFHIAYEIVASVSRMRGDIWSIQERVDVAYSFTFYGPTITARADLETYDQEAVMEVSDKLALQRDQGKSRAREFSGHQSRLSHYFRNLFTAYSFIESSKLSQNEKVALGKVLRSKLTVHEQALLAINIISHLGRNWELSGILGKYKIIKNVPKKFLTLDKKTTLKDLFEYIDFEWEEHRGAEIKSHRINLLGVTVFIHRNETSKHAQQGSWSW